MAQINFFSEKQSPVNLKTGLIELENLAIEYPNEVVLLVKLNNKFSELAKQTINNGKLPRHYLYVTNDASDTPHLYKKQPNHGPGFLVWKLGSSLAEWKHIITISKNRVNGYPHYLFIMQLNEDDYTVSNFDFAPHDIQDVCAFGPRSISISADNMEFFFHSKSVNVPSIENFGGENYYEIEAAITNYNETKKKYDQMSNKMEKHAAKICETIGTLHGETVYWSYDLCKNAELFDQLLAGTREGINRHNKLSLKPLKKIEHLILEYQAVQKKREDLELTEAIRRFDLIGDNVALNETSSQLLQHLEGYRNDIEFPPKFETKQLITLHFRDDSDFDLKITEDDAVY